MYRFFCTSEDKIEDNIYINGKDYHHIKNVLRLKSGDKVQLVIDDTVMIARLEAILDETIHFIIIKEELTLYESLLEIHLIQAMLKSDKLEWVIQKCVELGVSEVTLMNTSRVVVKYDEIKINKKIQRYKKIIETASKQSKRSKLMRINPPRQIDEFKDLIGPAFVCYEEDHSSLKEYLIKHYGSTRINVFIGPEGGFSKDEINLLRDLKAKSVSMGNRILRAETAAVAVCSIIQYEIGDICG